MVFGIGRRLFVSWGPRWSAAADGPANSYEVGVEMVSVAFAQAFSARARWLQRDWQLAALACPHLLQSRLFATTAQPTEPLRLLVR